MRVAFVLPAPVRVPQGGAAVVVQHARGLVGRGHQVEVIAAQRGAGVWPRVHRGLARVRDGWHGVAGDRPLEGDGVQVREPETLRRGDLIPYDAVIATGHQTARAVSASRHGRGGGFYFLQGDERALRPSAADTWRLPLVRFAVSDWVARLVEAHGQPVAGVVPNAVDPTDWQCDRAPESRERRVVALYHRHPVKGPGTLIGALERLRRWVPDVRASVVCARPPSDRLPRWVDVHVRPSQPELRGLYNAAAVCLHTSVVEGWGLVPMEAAACGCAVVATASRGPREYLVDGRSMAEVPVGDAAGLARESAVLLLNPDRRQRLARAAMEDVARFSWSASTDRLEAILTQHAS